ncbi:ParA family protein [Nocardia sp. NPDC003979]
MACASPHTAADTQAAAIQWSRELRLRDILAPVLPDYDLVLIDNASYLGPSEPMTSARGTCIAIIHRLHDDDKLIVVPDHARTLDDAAIAAAVDFQETTGQYFIIRN